MEQVWEIPRFAMLMLSFSKRLDVGSEERWRERTPGFDAWEYLKYLLRLRSALLQSQIAGHFEVGWIYSCVVFSAASLSESSFGELHVYFILRWTCNSAISLHIISWSPLVHARIAISLEFFWGHAILASTMHGFTTCEAKSMGFLV